MSHPRLVALAVTVPLAILVGAGIALAGSNSWVYLRAEPATGVRAQLALGAAIATGTGDTPGAVIPRPGGSQSVWVAVTGSASLDIIQLGAMVKGDGSRVLFAAWGRGEPNGPGSLYEEREFGPVNRSWHTYELVLVNGSWRMTIDGKVVLRVPDTFRTWAIRAAKGANEAEMPNLTLGGTLALPVRVQAARIWRGGWVLPTWHEGSAYAPPGTRDSFGGAWLKVWRVGMGL